jgi:hypothetical protein
MKGPKGPEKPTYDVHRRSSGMRLALPGSHGDLLSGNVVVHCSEVSPSSVMHAGTAEPVRGSPPLAVAYPLELVPCEELAHTLELVCQLIQAPAQPRRHVPHVPQGEKILGMQIKLRVVECEDDAVQSPIALVPQHPEAC